MVHPTPHVGQGTLTLRSTGEVVAPSAQINQRMPLPALPAQPVAPLSLALPEADGEIDGGTHH